MNSTPRDSVDLPDAESPARASRTGRSPVLLAATRGAIDGTEPSGVVMRPERTAGSLAADTATTTVGGPRRYAAHGLLERMSGERHATVERARGPDRDRQHPGDDRGGVGSPHLIDVRGAPARGAVRRPPSLRHQGPALPRQRPLHPREG